MPATTIFGGTALAAALTLTAAAGGPVAGTAGGPVAGTDGWPVAGTDGWPVAGAAGGRVAHAAGHPATGSAYGRAGNPLEGLDRGLVSIRSGDGNFVSWRLLAADPPGTAFAVYRGATRVGRSPVTGATNFYDRGAPAGASYTVRAVPGAAARTGPAGAGAGAGARTEAGAGARAGGGAGAGAGVEAGAGAAPAAPASPAKPSLAFAAGFMDVPLQVPQGGTTPDGVSYTYSAGDASVGDLDGDGQYEIVLKWDPSNAKDNSQSGYTGNVYVDAYRLNGTRLWRIDLGRNIRAGAHYTQFQVFDYDGDGRAEVAMKTADATVDGTGRVIGNGGADFRNSSGYVLSGPEFLTMFDGRTGAALQTVDFVPGRGSVSDWGDSYGNRVDRFLAGTAYVDGSRPSLIMARGYYTRSVITAWDWSGGRFTRRWTFDSRSSTNGPQWEGQGNHQLSVADVDADGRDEIVYGAMTVDDNGAGRYTTRLGHGDALHVGDLVPSRPGLETFKVDEDGTKPSSWMADARTGQILWSTPPNGDNGRGVSGDIWAGSPGAESWSARDGSLRDTSGQAIGRKPSSINFLVWWDGDAQRELLDGTHIDKYGTSGDTRLLTGSGVAANNGTKATPALSADILGDWREEVIWRTSNSSALRIYSTTDPTSIAFPSLMRDRQYRTAVAWQNTAYNQPPHPSRTPVP